MAKYCLAAFAVLLMVELISSQEPTVAPATKKVEDPNDVCRKSSNDKNATGSVDGSKPCEVVCLTGKNKVRNVVQRKDGAGCSEDDTPKVCVKKACSEQIAKKERTDKGFVCSSLGAEENSYVAVEKTPVAPCTVICVPDPTLAPNGKLVEMPAQIGTECSINNKAGTCTELKVCQLNK